MKNEIIRVAVLSEFWEKEKKDIIDLILPIVKVAIKNNYDSAGRFKIINEEKVLLYLKENLNNNLTRLVLHRAFDRLCQYGTLSRKDNTYCVDNEDEIFSACDKDVKLSVDTENKWKETIEDLKIYIKETEILDLFKLINIENKFWRFLNSENGLFYKDDEENHNADNYLAKYFLEKKKKNDRIYQYIKEFMFAIFISKAINILNTENTNVFEGKNIIIDTRFLMNILNMNDINENISAMELFNIFKINNLNISVYRHNIDEVHDVISSYLYQKNEYGCIKNHIDLFEREKYDESKIKIFDKTIDNKLREIGIFIIEKISDMSLEDTSNYEIDFEKNYYVKCDDYYHSREYDKKNYMYTMIKFTNKEPIMFVSTSKSLDNLFKKCYKKSELLFISDVDLACLYFVNNLQECKNVYIAKIISRAELLQRPTTEYLDNLEKRLKSYELDETIDANISMHFQKDLMAQKELYYETGFDYKNINGEKINCVLEKMIKEKVDSKCDEINKEKETEIIKIKDEKNREIKEKISVINDLKNENAVQKVEIKELNEMKIKNEKENANHIEKDKKRKRQFCKDANICSWVVFFVIILLISILILILKLKNLINIGLLNIGIINSIFSIFASSIIVFIVNIISKFRLKLKKKVEEFLLKRYGM